MCVFTCVCFATTVAGTHDYAKEKKREREAKQKKLKVLEDAKKKSECYNVHTHFCLTLSAGWM